MRRAVVFVGVTLAGILSWGCATTDVYRLSQEHAGVGLENVSPLHAFVEEEGSVLITGLADAPGVSGRSRFSAKFSVKTDLSVGDVSCLEHVPHYRKHPIFKVKYECVELNAQSVERQSTLKYREIPIVHSEEELFAAPEALLTMPPTNPDIRLSEARLACAVDGSFYYRLAPTEANAEGREFACWLGHGRGPKRLQLLLLLPVALAIDILTSPFQLFIYLASRSGA